MALWLLGDGTDGPSNDVPWRMHWYTRGYAYAAVTELTWRATGAVHLELTGNCDFR